MVLFDGERLEFEDGVMFADVTIDGVGVRAGITLDAFERLALRAGYDPDRDFGQVMVKDMIAVLRPAIEAHLQSKNFRAGGTSEPLIIGLSDLVTH